MMSEFRVDPEVMYLIGKMHESRGDRYHFNDIVIEQYFTFYNHYQFAAMLKGVFDRGYIAWVAPEMRCAWVDDTTGVAYDFKGPLFNRWNTEYLYIIPIKFAESICDKFKCIFRHTSKFGDELKLEKKDIIKVCRAYCAANNIEYEDPFGDWNVWKGDTT